MVMEARELALTGRFRPRENASIAASPEQRCERALNSPQSVLGVELSQFRLGFGPPQGLPQEVSQYKGPAPVSIPHNYRFLVDALAPRICVFSPSVTASRWARPQIEGRKGRTDKLTRRRDAGSALLQLFPSLGGASAGISPGR